MQNKTENDLSADELLYSEKSDEFPVINLPALDKSRIYKIYSPRLVNQEDAEKLKVEIIKNI